MIERNIPVDAVRDALENGEVIEEYPADVPPRYLILGWNGGRPILCGCRRRSGDRRNNGSYGIRTGHKTLERQFYEASQIKQ
jgi:hypothetical protein